MSGLSYDFTDKAVSPWGGLRLIEETYRRCGLKQYLEEECVDLPASGSNRGYDPVDLAEGFMVSTILCATQLAHSGTLRNDEVIRRIFGERKRWAAKVRLPDFSKSSTKKEMIGYSRH